ncbi:MAG: hypothetical protein ACR2P7_07010 [bacterium]
MIDDATVTATATAATTAAATATRRRIARRLAWLALVAFAFALLAHNRFDVSAAGEPYSVSLNSPASFPVDI